MSPAVDSLGEDAALASLITQSSRVPAGRVEPYGPHDDQRLEWYACGSSTTPPVVFVHGGFFRPSIDRSHARLTASALAQELGAPVVLVEYRRISGHPEAAVADIRAVSDVLEGMNEDPSVWVGHSAGGALVLQRAFDRVRPAIPAVALAPIADLRTAVTEGLAGGAVTAWLGTRRAAKPSRYADLDPGRLALELPERLDHVVCLHGEDDCAVPPSQSSDSGIPHQMVSGAHHYDLIDPESEAWPVVLAAIRSKSVQP
ncbi:MAG: alpha/beta hydrolase [Dermatophilaceae bacterium]|nr:alpha/beta hydrolase [Intrasporangiaceae bacterium]